MSLSKSDYRQLPWLHVYGQYMHHHDAVIRGTTDGLTALRSAIDTALASGSGVANAIAADGEGYSVQVICSATVKGLGTPEYIYQREYELGYQAARRQKDFRLPPPQGD